MFYIKFCNPCQSSPSLTYLAKINLVNTATGLLYMTGNADLRANDLSFSEIVRDPYSFLSYFFVKKISLSRRDEYVVDGSMDQ